MTTIKITELTDIGANLASSTVLPVVNMSGTPTTEKTVIGNIANVVLAGAGGNYVAAAKATIADTVTTNAQPNITSTGNLTGLTVSNSSGVVNFSNTANVTLGAVGNLHISGGTSGQLLSTNGNGILSWVSDSTTYGNSNVAAYLPTYTGNIGVDTLVFADNSFQATAFVGTATTAEGLSNVGNATIVVDPLGANTVWTFSTDGNLELPGDIVGPANANLTIYANAGVHEFIFGDDGTFYAPDNVVLGGDSIYIGPGANTLTGIEHEVFLASSNHFAYVQGVINNISDNGSAEWVALGARGDDSGGWGEIGFTSSGFGDANYTITGGGDGYVFAQSYAPGQTLLGGGGNLVLATGNQGSVKDIIFGTGGFSSSNIFGRISHSNNSLELTRTGASLKFPDGSTQTTAYIGSSNPFDQDLNTTDNVTFANITSTDAIRFSNSSNIVGALGYAPNYVSIEGYGSNTVNITANDVYTWSFDGVGNLTVPGNIISTVATGLTLGSNYDVYIVADRTDNNRTWKFDGAAGELILPNNGIIDPSDNNFEVRGIQNVNFEANANVNFYTDTSNNGWQWQFGDNGNTGFPGNLNYNGIASPSPSINGFSSASFNMHLTADQVYLSDNVISTVGGSSNLILNTQYGTATDSFIQVPTFQDGGEELIIKNGYVGSLGIRVQTGSGNFRFNGNDLTFTDASTQNTAWTGSVAGANVTGTVGNANLSQYLAVSDVNNNFSYHVVLSAGSGDKSLHIDADDNLQYNPADGTLTSTRVDATYVLANLNFANGYLASNVVGLGNIATANLDGNSSNVLYGNGVFAAIVGGGSSSNISNGNSNVSIATSDGNVTIAAVGNSVVTITGTGANITGTANITGNANVGNLGVASVVATANISTTGYFISGNQATGGFQLGNSNSRLKSGDSNSYMTMGQNPAIYPDTTASATAGILIGGNGYLLGNNGSRCITLNYGGSGGVVGLNANLQVGTAGSGTVLVPGTVTTGVNSLLAGPTFTPLANTMAGFVSNVNYYTQLTIQNKNTGTDATTDFVATADNGSDTVNYLDMGIINSGYDNGTPTNSLGNIVFAADSYMYAQGNTGNASQSGGNLAIGTTVAGKNVKIFAGGVDNTAIVANIANTGITVTGNLSVSGNISGNTNGYTIGYLNIPQVSASNVTLALTDAGKHYYSTTAGNLTLTVPLNSSVAFPTGTAISIVVQAAGNILVNAASGVTLYMAGNSTSANRVVGTYGMATLMKVASDTWFINGTGVS